MIRSLIQLMTIVGMVTFIADAYGAGGGATNAMDAMDVFKQRYGMDQEYFPPGFFLKGHTIEDFDPQTRDLMWALRREFARGGTETVDMENVFKRQMSLFRQQKGSLFVTVDTAHFFMAVAVVDFWECYHTRDPARCNAFAASLYDPANYLGFLMFVQGSRMVSNQSLALLRASQLAKSPKIGHKGLSEGMDEFLGNVSGPLSMTAGLLASDVFNELYYQLKEERFWDLRTCGRQESGKDIACDIGSEEFFKYRFKILNKVADHTFFSGSWWKRIAVDTVTMGVAAEVNEVFWRKARDEPLSKIVYAARNREYELARSLIAVEGPQVFSSDAMLVKAAKGPNGNLVLAYQKWSKRAEVAEGVTAAVQYGYRMVGEAGLFNVYSLVGVGASILSTAGFLWINEQIDPIVRKLTQRLELVKRRNYQQGLLNQRIEEIVDESGKLTGLPLESDDLEKRKKLIADYKDLISQIEAIPRFGEKSIQLASEVFYSELGRLRKHFEEMHDLPSLQEKVRSQIKFLVDRYSARIRWTRKKLDDYISEKGEASAIFAALDPRVIGKKVAEDIRNRSYLEHLKAGLAELEAIPNEKYGEMKFATRKVQETWAMLRSSIIADPQEKIMHSQLDQAEKSEKFARMNAYNNWILQFKMDENADYFKDNLYQWHPPEDKLLPIRQWYGEDFMTTELQDRVRKSLEDFYCSPLGPYESVTGGGNRQGDGLIGGFFKFKHPYFAQTLLKIHPYRVVEAPELCLDEIDASPNREQELDRLYVKMKPTIERFMRNEILPRQVRDKEFELPEYLEEDPSTHGLGKKYYKLMDKLWPIYLRDLRQSDDFVYSGYFYKGVRNMRLAEERFNLEMAEQQKLYWVAVQKPLLKALGEDERVPEGGILWNAWDKISAYWNRGSHYPRVSWGKIRTLAQAYHAEIDYWQSMVDRYHDAPDLHDLFERNKKTAEAGLKTAMELRKFVATPVAQRPKLPEATNESVLAQCKESLGECDKKKDEIWLENQKLLMEFYGYYFPPEDVAPSK